jgi:hypothetical protein
MRSPFPTLPNRTGELNTMVLPGARAGEMQTR